MKKQRSTVGACSMVACGNIHTYPCTVCGWRYCKLHAHFYQGRAYCADHIPPNDKPMISNNQRKASANNA